MSTTNIPSAARSASGLAILLAAVLVVAACASAGGALVAADRAVHLAVSETQDTADHLCDQKVLTPAACQTFNAALVPVIEDAAAFNRAVRADSTAEVPAMIGSIERLSRSVLGLLPNDEQRAAIKARFDHALELLRAIGGK